MILISDSGDGGDHLTHQHADVITQPFVTQTYSCVAAYETKDMKNRPFNVAEDEKLDVLIKDPAGSRSRFEAATSLNFDVTFSQSSSLC